MTQAQFEVRQERAENGTLIVSRNEEGFRVYSVHNPSHMYLVRQEGEHWKCTCPDFETHKADTTWRCKHILAVAPWKHILAVAPGQKPEQAQAPEPSNGQVTEMPAAAAGESQPPVPPQSAPPKRTRKSANGSVQMLIKRSVSPDGRIDSVSVEFSMPVVDISNGAIKDKALKTLQLQKEIVGAFLKLNGQKAPASTVQNPPPSRPEKPDGKPVFARMLDIGKVNGKWGERFCINFAVNGHRSRLFGSASQLADRIHAAGYEIDPENIEEGLRLNLACRVITKPSDDGKYLNVETVLPAGAKVPKGGLNDSDIPY